jgi:DNA-binding PadR family transcriptional regulator
LLLLLAENESHGYELCDQLSAFGFEPDRLDSSIVYRDLRDMEEAGLIDSYWDEDSKGPRRRVYRLREEGKERLKEWIASLGETKGRIDALIQRYQTLQRQGKED